MDSVLEVCGWVCLSAAAGCAVACNIMDRRLRQHRVGRTAEYWIVWLRWEDALYRPEAREQVRLARRMAAWYFMLAPGGVLLWLIGHAMK